MRGTMSSLRQVEDSAGPDRSGRDGVAGDALGGRIPRGPEPPLPLPQEDLAAPRLADPAAAVGIAAGTGLEPALGEHRHADAGDRLDPGADDLGLQAIESLHAPFEELFEGDRQRRRDRRAGGVWAEGVEAQPL